MTKNEFMTLLTEELNKRSVPDAADVIDEYQQHFAFKLADGYSEEEIAAKLGDPVQLAAQFEPSIEAPETKSSGRPLVVAGFCFADIFAGMIFALLFAWDVVMAAGSISFAAISVGLLGGQRLYTLLPSTPYWCCSILGLSLAPLSVLFAVGCVYFTAFLRQLWRSFARFQHNALATASGKPALPPLSTAPHFSAKTARRLRSIALVSLALFAVFFVLAYLMCSLSARSLQFWHVWNWFVS